MAVMSLKFKLDGNHSESQHFINQQKLYMIVSFYFQQWSEAAMLYEKGGYFDKAAAVYIRSKNW